MKPKPITLAVGRFILCMILFGLTLSAIAQADSASQKLLQSFNGISEKSLRVLDNKYGLLQKLVAKKTEKMLARMQKKEAQLQGQMNGKDSLKAKQLFANTQATYQQLTAQLQSPQNNSLAASFKGYIPGLDSMQTTMKFLSQGATIPGIPAGKLQQVQSISANLQVLQGKLQVAGQAQDYIRQREQQLKAQLLQYGMGKQLLGMNKEVFYYQQQLAEYKTIFNDKEKMQQLVLGAVRELPAFQSFWHKYSILAQLFPMPANFGTSQALNGLQSRSDIQAILQHAGASISSSPDYVHQQVQQAQSTLSQMKDKVSNVGGTSGSGDMSLPDFNPNPQHTKKFLNRLEYGFNIQNAQSTGFLPTTSTIGLTVGYKLSNKATTGIGASYMMGWGRGLNNISLSSQGVGLRSFVDIKAKGSIWVTGGLEYNYYQQFSKLSDIQNLDSWQKSALIGLTKKTSIGKKMANLQLLYDLLHNEDVPRGQAFKFRIGYTF